MNESTNIYFRINRLIFRCVIISVGFVLLFASCSPLQHAPDDALLLNRSTIKMENPVLTKNQLRRYQRQVPNRRLVGVKFHLWLYNLANPEKEKFPHDWLRRIGEPPVIYDATLQTKTREQFERYLEIKGYHYAEVTDTGYIRGRKVQQSFYVVPNEPYLIASKSYTFIDQNIDSIVYADTSYSLVKTGSIFDKELLQAERDRLTDIMKRNGYFKFRKEYISFTVNRREFSNQVELEIHFNESREGYLDPITKIVRHKPYIVKNTSVYTQTAPLGETMVFSDTAIINNTRILYRNERYVKPQTVASKNLLLPNTLFNPQLTAQTNGNYLSLGIVKLANINFSDPNAEEHADTSVGYLNCKIELTPRKQHSTQFEIVGTNSSGDLGARANIIYNNFNLFHGAEHLKIILTGALESVQNRQNLTAPMREFGIESQLDIPKFLLPFRATEFTRKYNPSTTLHLSYNYQDRPDYLRTIVNSSFGYYWRAKQFHRHAIFPISLDYVRLPEGIRDSKLEEDIAGTPLESSYTNHSIVAVRYTYEFSNQRSEYKRNFQYEKFTLESAGFVLSAVKRSYEPAGPDTAFVGVPFFQYIKADSDFRQYFRMQKQNTLVLRLFLGAGYAYGVSESMPFEKMYYAGGPYGIRAWSTRSLGPGSYVDSTSNFANNLGDIKIEGNIEYRFKIFWKLEGAIFLDGGNIWLFRDYPGREGAVFRWDQWTDQIALGTGLGARFDFSFILVRTDFGYKLRDPSITNGRKWNFNDNPNVRDPWVFQFGISYPF